jgi:DNA-binding MarR family transcriptional regulator
MPRTADRHTLEDGELAEELRAAGPALAQLVLQPLWALDPDVTIRQFRLLGLLDEAGPGTLRELATRLRLDLDDLAGCCEILTRKNLVQRAPSPGDGRAVRGELTDAGAAFLEHVQQTGQTGIRATLTHIRAGERLPLVRALRSLAAAAGSLP